VDKSIFIKCQCFGEGMGVDFCEEDGYYYFSYWSSGLSNNKLSWRGRLRYCWNTLLKGKAFNDEIILNEADADKLVDFILGNKKLSEHKMQELLSLVRENFKKE
jgi:hypothetical protein